MVTKCIINDDATLALYLFIYVNPTIFIFITYEIENFDQRDLSSEKKCDIMMMKNTFYFLKVIQEENKINI